MVMRSLAVFLLGIIVGVVGMLFLPELTPRREQLNTELKKQIDVLQTQVRELGDQLKNINLPKLGDEGAKKASPSPSASAQ
jgi:uncharacterized membrane-anchored protein YhcB (DUF1043 family)